MSSSFAFLPMTPSSGVADPLDETIRNMPICIVWTKTWAGELGKSVLYRLQRLDKDRLLVGYFAYWSTERAWGDNGLTRWFVPAVAIDGVYGHLLFVLPGLQRVIYGPGDVEGIRVTYQLHDDLRLTPASLVADTEGHNEVRLPVNDAVDERGRIFVYNDVWSHQLGGPAAVRRARTGAPYRCFSQERLVPLTEKVVSDFRLGSPKDPRRAGPAWSETP